MLLPEASTLNLWMTVVSLFKIFAFVDLFVGPILLTFIACLYFCHPSPTEAMFETCAKHAGMLWQSWAINLFNFTLQNDFYFTNRSKKEFVIIFK